MTPSALDTLAAHVPGGARRPLPPDNSARPLHSPAPRCAAAPALDLPRRPVCEEVPETCPDFRRRRKGRLTMDAPAQGALAGLKVIDLTRVLGGPYCTHDPGRPRRRGDQGRAAAGRRDARLGPALPTDGDASYFIGVNRNKRAIALDLARPEGRAVLLRLLDGADVLIENFKPGGMEKWGLGYDERPRADVSPA